MDKKYLAELIKNIQSMIRCPNCGSSYKTNMISIVGGAGHTFLVHLECSVCGLPTMATVMFRQQTSTSDDLYKESSEMSLNFSPALDNGLSSTPKIPPQDKNKNLSEKVTTDDVLDMHNFLQDFDGDFESLFKK